MDQQALQEAREYHARRNARRRQEREQLRQEHYRRVTAAIQDLAPRYPAVRAVYLFGSIVRPGRYRPGSDIDIAVDCDDVAAESRLWRDLEQSLKMSVDLRPCKGAVAWAVENYGECVYDMTTDCQDWTDGIRLIHSIRCHMHGLHPTQPSD